MQTTSKTKLQQLKEEAFAAEEAWLAGKLTHGKYMVALRKWWKERDRLAKGATK